MTPLNLDLARECGGIWRAVVAEHSVLCFTLTNLDAFAERIRADERASVASATVQPVALPAVTVEHDSTPLPAGMPEPVARASKGPVAFLVKWTESGKSLRGAAIDLYTSAQVQAMLAHGAALKEEPSCSNCKHNKFPFGMCDGCEMQKDNPQNEGNWEAAQAASQLPVARPSLAAVGPDALCPECDGSGETSYTSDAGPDAYDSPCNCSHCDGSGTISSAKHLPPPDGQPLPVERKPLTCDVLHAHFTPFYLLTNCRRICAAKYQREPNWAIARELFAVGSTTAGRICREAEIDPDAFEVRKVGITAQQGGST